MVTTTIRLDKDLWIEAKTKALQLGLRFNDYLVSLIQKDLRNKSSVQVREAQK